MNTQSKADNPLRVLEQAAKWLQAKESDEPFDHAGFDDWLNRSPLHRAAIEQVRATDAALERLPHESWERIEASIEPERTRQSAHFNAANRVDGHLHVSAIATGVRHHRRGLSALAAVAAIIFIGWIIWPSTSTVPWTTYTSSATQIQPVTLPDDSIIVLNTTSEVTVRFTAHRRDIRLIKGEARVSVAHDAHRPLFVEVNGATVRAVGTEFNVRALEQKAADVFVTEGRVFVQSASQGRFVDANQLVSISGATFMTTTLRADEVGRRMSWMMIVLQNTTLAEATSEFNRYNRVKLVVGNGPVAHLRMGGTFNATRPERFARAVATTFNLQATREKTTSGEDVIRIEEPRG